jgi:hypothetical protein
MAAAAPPPALQAANQNRPPGPPSGKIADNIAHFARVLRDAGVPVGPGQVLDALDAATMGGLGAKEDFYWTLHAVFVKRREHKALFDQAFHVFWRRPKMIEQMMQLLFQQVRVEGHPRKKEAGQRRLANAMFAERDSQQSRRESPGEIEIEGEYSASADEVLRARDFEQMTAEEEANARAAIRRMRLHRTEVKTRRFGSASRGRADLRRTIRQSLRSGGAMIDLQHKRPRTHEPPLVVLTDISGSCTTYSRMFLHFLHALKTDRDRVSVFVFGTRLTNITRELDRRDVDEALEKVAGTVKDWSGGTRIGRTLKEFNWKWGRRVLSQGAHVLIMSDGLEREDCAELAHEMARLKRSCRRVVWLNPLLRYKGFAASAGGIRAMLPHVDEFRPVHNLASLEELAKALTYSPTGAHDPRLYMRDDRRVTAGDGP